VSSSSPWDSRLGLEAVIRQMPVAVMVVEAPSLKIVEFNDAAREMTERKLRRRLPERLEDAWEIFHPDGQPYVMADWPLMRSIDSGEEVIGEEYFNLLADGSRLVVRCNSSPILDDQGEIVAGVLVMEDITERKRVEQALGEALGQTEMVLESISDEFFAVDYEWRYVYVNERAIAQAAVVIGRELTAEDFLGKRCWELFPQFVGTSFDYEFHRALREQTVVRFEAYSPPTGRWVEVRVYPSERGLSVYSHDITARKRAEQELRYHASLLDNVEDGVIATDAEDFRVTAWNRGAERLYGFAAEEVLGRSAREVASYPSDEARVKLERELLETGRTRAEFTARRKDGTAVDVELVAVAVKGERGEITYYLGIHRDITDRKRAKQELREARALTEDILESISDAFFAVDRDWRYTYLNQRAVTQVRTAIARDVTAKDLLGTSCWETFPEWVGTPVYEAYHQVLREQRTAELEVYVERIAGWLEVRLYGTASGVSTYLRDITERKAAEERLEETRESERSRIARALHDQALQPLADALVLAMAAREASPESGPAGQVVAALQRVGEELRAAIYDLRSNVEQNDPFPELLEELVGVQRKLAVDSEIELDLGDGVPTGPLGAAGVEVLRIVGEALTNAHHHADARHVRVRVWGTQNRLRAEVSDNGRGFDPTSPASALHHGLAGMRERADLLDGHLEIQSEPGAGTTVRLEARVPSDTTGRV
jgi:PAS domain S-box-containing protein